jgi:MinD-like ATPase involved in chromosome partitioning or flagellar assembly
VPGPVIAVWSPKGGVGKTLIACGLAMHLVRRCAGGAVLVDLDADKAEVAPLLQCSSRPSILEFPAETYPEPGGRSLVTLPGGLAVLPGPGRLVDEGLVTRDLAERVLTALLRKEQAVVIDLGTTLRDSTLVTLDRASAVLLIVTPDLLSIYPARRFALEAELIGLDPAKFRLVVNRASPQQSIPMAEIADLVPIKGAGRLPSLPGLANAVNSGLTSTTMRQNTEFAIAIQSLADQLSFAGVPRSPLALPAQLLRSAGLLPILKRWWRG